MPLKKIRVTINDIDFKTTGIVTSNKITYHEKDDAKVVYDIENQTIERDTKDLKVKYVLKENEKTTGELYMKELKNTYEVDVHTLFLRWDGRVLEVEYKIEAEKFKYKIEVLT